LSRLAVDWIRLGIYPELIAPGSPQQNGAHERMHRALKADTTRPPARLYTPSRRRWPKIVEPLVYPGHSEVRRVSAPGVMWWPSQRVSISTVLIGESIGLEPIDDGEWDLHFGPLRLGRFDERTYRIQPLRAGHGEGRRVTDSMENKNLLPRSLDKSVT
jgi:putative transposase